MLPGIPQPWRWQTRHDKRQKCKPDNTHLFYERKQMPYVFCLPFFHFRKPPGLKLAFDAVKRNEKIWPNLVPENQRKRQNRKKKTQIFLCRRTLRGKVIPTSFPKIEEKGLQVRVEEWRKGKS